MQMKKILALAVVGLSLAACNSPGERAVGGALIGGGAGALLGGAVAGSRGVAAGAAIGAVSGAVIGAATTPTRRGGTLVCPRGTYLASDGYCYSR
jgi:osmotically inducible lipoprotein OsmB